MQPRLSPGQMQAWANSTAYVNIWSGSVSAGKTFTWVLMMLNKIMTAPSGGEIVIMGHSTSSVYRNVFKVIESHEVMAGLADSVQYSKNSDVATIFGRQVHVIGASNTRAANRIQGMTIRYAFVDEGALMPEEVFKMLMTRLRAPGAQCFITTNPGSNRHYLLTDYIQRPELTGTYYQHMAMADNPGLPDGYAERQAGMFTGVFYKRYIEGKWVAAEGAIFDFFDEAEMVVSELPKLEQIISVGVDYGATNPTAGIALAIGTDGALYAHAEWAPRAGLRNSELAEDFRRFHDDLPAPPRFVYVDPSAKAMREELAHHGIRTNSANNEVLDGINQLGSLLAGRQLFIHSSCRHLLDEIPEYSWDKTAEENGQDKPVKVADHWIDALRYAVRSSRHLWDKRLRPAQINAPEPTAHPTV